MPKPRRIIMLKTLQTPFFEPTLASSTLLLKNNKLIPSLMVTLVCSFTAVSHAELSMIEADDPIEQTINAYMANNSTPSITYSQKQHQQPNIPTATTQPKANQHHTVNLTTSTPNSSYGYSLGDNTDFLAAQKAAKSGDIASLQYYQQQMQHTLFTMYPEYWLLNDELVLQPANRVINFTKKYWQTVMGEKLIADYAEAKANAGDYAAVRQVTPYITNADSSEACAIALGQNLGGDAMVALAQKPKVWLKTSKQPQLCTKLANELNHNPLITQQDRQQRLLRMLRVGKGFEAHRLAQKLGVEVNIDNLANIAREPNTFFNSFAMQANNGLLERQKLQYQYIYAIARLADKSTTEAYVQLKYDINQDDIHPQPLLEQSTRQYAYRIIAMARMDDNVDSGFDENVVNWFAASVGIPFSFEEAENYAQMAIRYSRWLDVLQAISAMDETTQQQAIWQYWIARSYNHIGNKQQKQTAQQIYHYLAQKTDYYGLLAKDQLGQRFSQLPYRTTAMSNDFVRLDNNPHFARAFALYNMGASRVDANREWNWAVRQARLNHDDALILAAASRANDLGWFDRSIYAAEHTVKATNVDLAYLMPYQQTVRYYSNQVGIDPAWAYGLMRQESRFITSARSNVGAGGLMQIMPATARFIARKLGEPYNASRVNTRDTNIRYGTFYMSHILQELNYQPVLATAGYNAGPNRAKRWQPEFIHLPADQYIESIPFSETRHYVKAVMTNASHYGLLLGKNSQSISKRMGSIPPKGGSTW